jgi:hypothetical protein
MDFGKGLPLLEAVPDPTQVFPPGVTRTVLDKVIAIARARGFDDPREGALMAILMLWEVRCQQPIVEKWTFIIRGAETTLPTPPSPIPGDGRPRSDVPDPNLYLRPPSIAEPWAITKTDNVGLRRSRAVWARFPESRPPSIDEVDEGALHYQPSLDEVDDEAIPDQPHDELPDHPWDNLPLIFDTHYTGVRRRSCDKGAAWRRGVWPKHRKKYQEVRSRREHAGGPDAQWDQHLEMWERVGWSLDEGQVHWTATTTDMSVEDMARLLGKSAKEIRTINQQAIGRLAKAHRNGLIVTMLNIGASYKQVQEATSLSRATIARVAKQAREANVRLYPTALELRFEPCEQIVAPWAYDWEYDDKARATTKFEDDSQKDNSRFAKQALDDLLAALDDSPCGNPFEQFRALRLARQDQHNNTFRSRFQFMEDDMPLPPPPEEAVREAPAVLMLPDGRAIGTKDGIRRVIGTRDSIRFIRPVSVPDEHDPGIVAWQAECGADEVAKRIIYGATRADEDGDRLVPERPVRQDDGTWLLLPSPPRTRVVATRLRLVRPLRRRRPW